MTLLQIIFAPAGPITSWPRPDVVSLVVTYDPPVRPVRPAPPNLRGRVSDAVLAGILVDVIGTLPEPRS